MSPLPQPLFVGREKERARWDEILRDETGQAVLVSGPSGMGKTALLDRMAVIARDHLDLVCGAVRYEVTATDAPDAIMELMIDHAFDAAQAKPGSFDKTDQQSAQWRALFGLPKVVPGVGPAFDAMQELAASLRPRSVQQNVREQFMDRLRLISKRMPKHGRAVFVLDPEKYMWAGSADAWRIVVRDLPPKIKFVFAQRSEDELARSGEFRALANVIDLCGGELAALDAASVEKMANAAAAALSLDAGKLLAVFKRYDGHPYALAAAVHLLRGGLVIEDLPDHPDLTLFARLQWQGVCDSRHGEKAIRLLRSYAVAEAAVPDEIARRGADLTPEAFLAVRADAVVGTLLRDGGGDGGGDARLYHAILADFVRDEMDESQARPYHERLIAVYRERLGRTPADPLAARMLPMHVEATEGLARAITVFINECTPPLLLRGELNAFEALSHRYLSVLGDARDGDRAALLGNLGRAFQTRGDLKGAKAVNLKAFAICEELGEKVMMANIAIKLGGIFQMRGGLDNLKDARSWHCQGLTIHEELGNKEGMASGYGNLGMIAQICGDLANAETMFLKSLAISKDIGNKEGMANCYVNLGINSQMQIPCHLEAAESFHRKALEIHEELGSKDGVANDYGNLSGIFQMCGDLVNAETMLGESLAIFEELGHKEGMANGYANLGRIFQMRGDMGKAKELWQQALALFKEMGMQPQAKMVREWLAKLE